MNYAEEVKRIQDRMLELNDKATYTKGQDIEFYDEIEEELEALGEELYELIKRRARGL